MILQVRRGRRASPWLAELLKRKAPKLAAVALAIKMARIAWKLMFTGETYIAGSASAPWRVQARDQPDTGSNSTATVLCRCQNLQDDEQVVRSIDPRYGTLRKLQWPFIGRSCVWNPCRGNHLGQRSRVSALKGRTYRTQAI